MRKECERVRRGDSVGSRFMYKRRAGARRSMRDRDGGRRRHSRAPLRRRRSRAPLRLLLNDALLVALVVVVLQAARRARSADLHLDLGEPILQLPLLLVELDTHRRILRLHRV